MLNLEHKTILVTGGTGLVGSHLVEALVNRGCRIIVLYRDTDPWSYFTTQHLHEKVVLAPGDIVDRQRIFEIVTQYEVEVIFHLAAQALVPQAFINPAQTFDTNITGTVNVLEAARLYGKTQAVIVASSDKAYGKANGTYLETDPVRGDHPYDTSKSATDMIAQTYAVTYNLPVIVTRFGNIYGEGDLNFNRLIPGLMKSILRNEIFEVRSDGTLTRDYVYVKDVVSGYLFLAERIDELKGEAFNLTSHEHRSVLEVIQQVGELLGKPVQHKILNVAQNEIPHQQLNDDKIKKYGWKSIYHMEQMIPQIYEWYKKVIYGS